MDLTTGSRMKRPNNKYSALLAFAICVAIIGGTYSSLFAYAALLLSVVAVAASSEEDSICLLMMLMPFANIFKPSATAQSFFTYLILFYVCWRFIKRRHINTSFLANFLLLIIFLVIQMVISMNILRTIKFVANVLLVYFAINRDTSENNKRIYLYYILGIIASSAVAAIGMIPDLNSYIRTKGLTYSNESLARFAGLYGDPNYYSVNVIISLCLVVILYHKKQLRTVPALLLAAALVTFSIMTFSKSAFLMLLLPLFMLLYSRIRRRKYFMFVLLSLAAVLLLASTLAGNIDAFEVILSRVLTSEDAGSLTTGRIGIWSTYIEYLGNSLLNILLGGGFNLPLINNRAAHNTYIDLIYYLGMVGTVLLGGTFRSVSKLIPTKVRRNFLNYSVWLCIAAMYFFLSELFYFDWAFHIIIAMLVLKTNMVPPPGGAGYEKASV